MPLAKLITNYSDKDQPIFAVEHLDQMMFDLGFRILNPEYRCTWDDLKRDSEQIKEYLNVHDQDPVRDNYIPNHSVTPKQREMRLNPGFDRSTPPKVY